MTGIIDYGLGNVKAFMHVYNTLNIPVTAIRQKDQLYDVDHIILPGVGAFDYAMTRLIDSGLREALDESVLERKIPVLGICVGMQMLTLKSSEGNLPGLGWIDAIVKRFDSSYNGQKVQIPHMGWNDVTPTRPNVLFKDLERVPRFYFLHSYYVLCNNNSDSLALTGYGLEYSSAVNSGNVFGVQFHPEKSHHWGMQLLKNFAEL